MSGDRMKVLEKTALALAFTICVALGVWRARYSYNDLVPSYLGERCLLYGCDPYRGTGLLYPPSALVAMSPLALFNFRTAWVLWLLLNSGLLLVAVNLVLALCPESDKRLATLLGAIFLAGSSQLLSLAQPSALAISLVVIAACCLISGRLPWIGAVVLLLSLAVKPQIGGVLAVYWALRGSHCRQAILAIVGALALLLCGVLLLNARPTSVHWASESTRASLEWLRPAGLVIPDQPTFYPQPN